MVNTMTQVLTIANTKGGSGKTTLAVNLAAAFARRGRRVAVLDADRQQSAAAWIRDAEDPSLRRIAVGAAVTSDEIEAFAAKTDADLLIIDSQGALTAELGMCLALADLVLVPCRPGHDDIQGTVMIGRFLDRQVSRMDLDATPPLWVVMNGANPRSAVAHPIYRELLEAGFKVFKRGLAQRVAVAEASVNRCSLLRVSGEHRLEINAITDGVDAILNRRQEAA